MFYFMGRRPAVKTIKVSKLFKQPSGTLAQLLDCTLYCSVLQIVCRHVRPVKPISIAIVQLTLDQLYCIRQLGTQKLQLARLTGFLPFRPNIGNGKSRIDRKTSTGCFRWSQTFWELLSIFKIFKIFLFWCSVCKIIMSFFFVEIKFGRCFARPSLSLDWAVQFWFIFSILIFNETINFSFMSTSTISFLLVQTSRRPRLKYLRRVWTE